MLAGKTVLVTGAAGTIGSAVAHLAAELGADLFLIDREHQKLARLAAELPAGRVAWQTADITKAAEVEGAFSTAEHRFHALDAAVLAAGVEGPIGLIEDCDDADFATVMAVNVTGVWLALKASLGAMKPRRTGSIVMLSSIAGIGASPLLAPYGASKHAVLGLMRSAAREAAASGVRVNAVCPGPVKGEMMRRIDTTFAARYQERRGGRPNAAASLPMGRYAAPGEVAQIIGFLCSDASSYCTGGTYMIDGGYSAR